MLNKEVIQELINLGKSDRETLNFIKYCIDSFEEYHSAVFQTQIYKLVYGNDALELNEYLDGLSAADKLRTSNHNSVIGLVNSLNMMAESKGLAPVYDGIVSEEKPYRRQVANAVFEYIEDIINNRD